MKATKSWFRMGVVAVISWTALRLGPLGGPLHRLADHLWNGPKGEADHPR